VKLRLSDIIFRGPPLAPDAELIDDLPAEFSGLLASINGFVAFGGGLHVRGVCEEPEWHSLREAWCGDLRLSRLFPKVQPSDIPVAQDMLGDQYLLRDREIHHLAAETGNVDSLSIGLMEFLNRACADPVEYLSLQPLLAFHQGGGSLEPGQLLNAYPPFVFRESADSVSYAPIPAAERLRFLSDLAAQLGELPEGGAVTFEVAE